VQLFHSQRIATDRIANVYGQHDFHYAERFNYRLRKFVHVAFKRRKVQHFQQRNYGSRNRNGKQRGQHRWRFAVHVVVNVRLYDNADGKLVANVDADFKQNQRRYNHALQ
jgi:hypothetical protein